MHQVGPQRARHRWGLGYHCDWIWNRWTDNSFLDCHARSKVSFVGATLSPGWMLSYLHVQRIKSYLTTIESSESFSTSGRKRRGSFKSHHQQRKREAGGYIALGVDVLVNCNSAPARTTMQRILKQLFQFITIFWQKEGVIQWSLFLQRKMTWRLRSWTRVLSLSSNSWHGKRVAEDNSFQAPVHKEVLAAARTLFVWTRCHLWWFQ
jgi:hypothetical protein